MAAVHGRPGLSTDDMSLGIHFTSEKNNSNKMSVIRSISPEGEIAFLKQIQNEEEFHKVKTEILSL